MSLFKSSFISKITIFLIAAIFSVSAVAMDFRQDLMLANQGDDSAQYNFEFKYSNSESAHPYKIASQGISESVTAFVRSPATAQAEADIKEAQAAVGIETAQNKLDYVDRLATASKATTGKMNIYKDRAGQILLTNISPSSDFDKFTKKTKVTYYKDIEREWERQLNKKPAARIGMSHKQVLSDTNWGRPKDVRTTIDASGTLERWIYSSTHSLYFKGGELIKIEK
ncbi:hypothetical protein M0N77_10120 [Psychrobacter sp. AH5]|uniref:hypothetical protein n=1 Tax=Psychrobacter sp. AH5 TaxID=2937433 RepID=UPI00333FF012